MGQARGNKGVVHVEKANWTSFLAWIFNLQISVTHCGLCIYRLAPWPPTYVIIAHPLSLCLDLLAVLPIVFHPEEGSCALTKPSSSLGNTLAPSH